MSATIRTATADDVPGIAAVYGRAFAPDPVARWLTPGERDRERRLARLYGAIVGNEGVPRGATRIAVEAGEILGAAVWIPPGLWNRMRPDRALRLAAGSTRGLWPHAGRMVTLARAVYAAHPRRPAWYLSILGVDPRRQGSGIGTRLVAERLRACDTAREPVYLETSTPANVTFYERLGFRVTGDIPLPHGGPTQWTLWRDPAIDPA